jgi:hypothetical protein
VRRLLAATVAAVALTVAPAAVAGPVHGYYADGGSGGNRPDCTGSNLGNWFGNWVCAGDPFTGDIGWTWG